MHTRFSCGVSSSDIWGICAIYFLRRASPREYVRRLRKRQVCRFQKGIHAREYLRGLSAAAGLLVGAPCRKLGGLRAGSPAAAAALPPLARGAGSVRAVPPDPVDLVAPPLLLAAIS